MARIKAKVEEVYFIGDGAKCDIEKPVVCKMRTALGMAADISGFTAVEDIQFQTPGLQKILETQQASKSEMVAAIKEWAPTLPADRQQEGFWLADIVQEEV